MAISTDRQEPLQVIGGSIAGLMQGIMLKRLGHHVQIFERATSNDRAEGGTGITVGPDAQRFYHQYDLLKQSLYVDNPGIQFMNGQGNVTRFTKRPMKMSSWSLLHFNLRANFDGHKSSLCPDPPAPCEGDGEAIFHLGKKVIGVEYAEGDSRVAVRYQDLLQGEICTVDGDLVIVADGASSSTRTQLLPEVKRQYAGYLAWRGYVEESRVSQETRKLLDPNFTSFSFTGGYILSYIIPSIDGSLEPGKRRINWVWYHDCPETSPSFKESLTDAGGHVYRNYVPVGQIRASVWKERVEMASKILNPPFVELVMKTAASAAAISVIHDYASPKALFHNDKVLLVGDALALFRPHAALSFNQAAQNCLLMEDVMRKKIDLHTWEKGVTAYGNRGLAINEMLGGFMIYGTQKLS
ncbi:uncharacterized protein N7498_002699 [Penicillium cinerascens]|uniref:2,6-dihydroxypyridine 3-monooxygenase substrate binding domain-containing protein n=1 Tax=Penicillium cinerascens TaxID=70096 RepID=A0A9W9NAJ6_9EURO|nr:uncharacterized protein N7498_002699 [Penicillium cinerascens]KAJ5216292.1 hypothetical protein N7498_002699 [Penicillium cinerascens]